MNKLIALRAQLFSLLAVSFLIGTDVSAVDTFTKEEYFSFTHVVEQIAKRCPPKNCVVIGAGRSPTPFIAYLQAMDPKNAANIPMSDFRYGPGLMYGELKPDQEAILFQHFDKYFPSDADLHGRSVTVVDYAAGTGDSLMASAYYFDKYLKQRGRNVQVNKVILESPGNAKIRHSVDSIMLKFPEDQLVITWLDNHRFRDEAEFTEYNIKNPKPVQSRPEYQDLVQYLKEAQKYYKPISIEQIDHSEQLIRQNLASSVPNVRKAAILAAISYVGPERPNLLGQALAVSNELESRQILRNFTGLQGLDPTTTRIFADKILSGTDQELKSDVEKNLPHYPRILEVIDELPKARNHREILSILLRSSNASPELFERALLKAPDTDYRYILRELFKRKPEEQEKVIRTLLAKGDQEFFEYIMQDLGILKTIQNAEINKQAEEFEKLLNRMRSLDPNQITSELKGKKGNCP